MLRHFLALVSAPVRYVWGALVIVHIVWRSTCVGIEVAVETPTTVATGIRVSTAAALLAAVLASRGTSLQVTRAELAASAAVGSFLLGLGVGLVHVAETRIDSSVVATIADTVPPLWSTRRARSTR
jgi:hypothetical protein